MVDNDYRGDGFISGQTRVEGANTADIPVEILHRKSGAIVMRTISDFTGNFSFKGLSLVDLYDVIMRPPTKAAVISDSRKPVQLNEVLGLGVVEESSLGGTIYSDLRLYGGVGPYTMNSITGLPPGVTAEISDRNVVFSGNVQAVGTYSITFNVKDSGISTGLFTRTVNVANIGDPYYINVVSLVHLDGNVADPKNWGFSLSGTGAALVESSKKFGTHGLRIDGNDSSLKRTGTVTWPTNFTIEMWMRIGSYTGPKMPSFDRWDQCIFGDQGQSGAQDQVVYIDYSTGLVTLYRDSNYAGAVVNAGGIHAVPLGEFFHFAMTYDGTKTRIFVNGVKEIEVATANGWRSGGGEGFTIGRACNLGYQQYRRGANADFDEIRITFGVCRYTENFTPLDKPFIAS